MGKHFILVHGAWHTAKCWDSVVSFLTAGGHTAEALTLPGHGQGDDRASITFDNYVAAIVDAVSRQSNKSVLVGHSSAGLLIQSAAAKVAEKLEHLIFMNAFIIPHGKSQFDMVPPEARDGMTAAANSSPDNCIPVMEDFVRNMLMKGDSEEQITALLEQLIPQPLSLLATPIDASGFDTLTIPKSVVYFQRDASLPPGAFLGMAQALGKFKQVDVDGSHEALFTEPEKVAKAMISLLVN